MPTNKIITKTTVEQMRDYEPVYRPLYPLLMTKSVQYNDEVGKVELNRVSAMGDIRARVITPKDTEIRQVQVGEAKKPFNKYFLSNQYIHSKLQSSDDAGEVVKEVLDEHQKQFDEMALGDANNNGLFTSTDSNYVLNSSAAISASPDHLSNLHAQIMTQAQIADQKAGRKVIIFYGANVLSRFNGIYGSSNQPFKSVLSDVLGPDYEALIAMPADITPASSHGYMIVNLDQIKTHYMKLPELNGQGVNEEKLYAWFNFLMGSVMIEVLSKNGIIRQPLTFS